MSKQDISSLTDSELRQQLIEAGASVGPITSTTRRIFENKLHRLRKPPGEEQTSDVTQDSSSSSTTGCTSTSPGSSETANSTDQIRQPQIEPKSYFGIALLPGQDPPKDAEGCVFSDRTEALKAVKSYPGARFKEFPTKEAALEFASRSALIQTPTTPKPTPVTGESSEFKGPKMPELCRFRRYIEKGKVDMVRECVWANPRYLISSGDTPVILQEGCRYNALHVCALKNQPEVGNVVLETLEDESFMEHLYPQDSATVRADRIYHMLDLYLNMPDKMNCETPLHFACKFGNVEITKVLLAHPLTNRKRKNINGDTPEQIVCSRVKEKADSLRTTIVNLLHASYFVPLMRPLDKSGVAVIGEPRSLGNRSTATKGMDSDPTKSPLVLEAYAGPMSPVQAQAFRKKWMAHNSMQDRLRFLSICCQDDEKGQERIGRLLAQTEGVGWKEYWDFLEQYVDLSSAEGLRLLDTYLETRKAGVGVGEVDSPGTPDIIPEQSDPDDSFTEKMTLLTTHFAGLRVRSPSPLKVATNSTAEEFVLFKDSTPAKVPTSVFGSPMIYKPEQDDVNTQASLGESVESRKALGSSDGKSPSVLTKKQQLEIPIPRKTSDADSDPADYESCSSFESDRSFETYYTATQSPPRSPGTCVTPPRPETQVFLVGSGPTKVDSDVLHAIDVGVITPEFPNVMRWHKNVTAYSEDDRSRWSSPRRERAWNSTPRPTARPRTEGHTPSSSRLLSNPLQSVRVNLMEALADP